MTNIIKILDDNNWDHLAIEFIDNDVIVKEDFNTEHTFFEFINSNLDKYESELIEYKNIFDEDTKKITLLFSFRFNSKKKVLSTSYIKSLADDIMINLNQEEINEVKDIEESIREKFMKVLSINTEGVEPKYYPFDDSHTFLREDDESHINDHDDVLNNAPTKDGDYITIVKVVK